MTIFKRPGKGRNNEPHARTSACSYSKPLCQAAKTNSNHFSSLMALWEQVCHHINICSQFKLILQSQPLLSVLLVRAATDDYITNWFICWLFSRLINRLQNIRKHQKCLWPSPRSPNSNVWFRPTNSPKWYSVYKWCEDTERQQILIFESLEPSNIDQSSRLHYFPHDVYFSKLIQITGQQKGHIQATPRPPNTNLHRGNDYFSTERELCAHPFLYDLRMCLTDEKIQ